MWNENPLARPGFLHRYCLKARLAKQMLIVVSLEWVFIGDHRAMHARRMKLGQTGAVLVGLA